MKRWLALVVVALMVTTTFGARMQTAAQDATTVKVSETAELGKFLTDSEGRTLYQFVKDTEKG